MEKATSPTQSEWHIKVDSIFKILTPMWPLSTFIATNHIDGLTGEQFDDAIFIIEEKLGARGYLPLSEYRKMYEDGQISKAAMDKAFNKAEFKERHSPLKNTLIIHTIGERLDTEYGTTVIASTNSQLAKWCAAYLDDIQCQWQMPRKHLGLFAAWRELSPFDPPAGLRSSKPWKQLLKSMPADANAVISQCLSRLKVSSHLKELYLERHVCHLPGWAAHLKWRAGNLGEQILVDYLAIRLIYECFFLEELARRKKLSSQSILNLLHDAEEREITMEDAVNKLSARHYGAAWQEALEETYRSKLLTTLEGETKTVDHPKAESQLVFCIDVRSEPMRRHLETLPEVKTFGFAGFFGIPACVKDHGSERAIELCPVLLKPSKLVEETINPQSPVKAVAAMEKKTMLAQLFILRKKLKSSLAGTFGMVEQMGIFSLLPLLKRTFAPGMVSPTLESKTHFATQSGTVLSFRGEGRFSTEELVTIAAGNLKAIGLTKNFAPVVAFIGHHGQSANNPFASALDCGACGGNSGRQSARLAAAIMNDGEVREGLKETGINIPDETVFIAGEHNTTTGAILFTDLPTMSEKHMNALKNLTEKAAAFQGGGQSTARLPTSIIQSLNRPTVRAQDWAQVFPEWGLAGNAAFIAAPRDLTSGINLDGRAFLHSYICEEDHDNKVLELIMTAPMVVAHWINMQYYLSSVDNRVFGSGTKTVHNVVSDFGVLSGCGTDLRLGLPSQSIFEEEGKLRHPPLRLTVILRAEADNIDSILDRHENLARLVRGEWLKIISINPQDGSFLELTEKRNWVKVQSLISYRLCQASEKY